MPRDRLPRSTGRLQDRIALVTGGAGHLGEAVCRRLASDDATVMVADIHAEAAERIAVELSAMGNESQAFALDLTDVHATQAIAQTIIERFGRIDILCNVAGAGPRGPGRPARGHDNWAGKQFWEMDPATWAYHIDTNLYTCMASCYAVIPHMIEQRYGRILNWVTGSVLLGHRGLSVYSAAKGAVHALTKVLARELGEYGITVNDLSIGTYADDEYLVPAGRPGTPDDAADVAAFLVSDDARWLSAQSIAASGGQYPR